MRDVVEILEEVVSSENVVPLGKYSIQEVGEGGFEVTYPKSAARFNDIDGSDDVEAFIVGSEGAVVLLPVEELGDGDGTK